MADAQANINVNLNTSNALAQLKILQRQISQFHQAMSIGGAKARAESAQLAQTLINNVNASGKFSASIQRTLSTTESFTNALEKNKLSMGQYFRYGMGATKTFGRLFTSEFNTINKVARERVKTLQTQYIQLGRDANGAMQSIAIRPLSLDMKNLGTQVMMTAQKQQIFNQLLTQGSTNLLNFGKNTQWAGRQLMVGFTVPLTILGTTAAREFMKLEEQAVKFRRVYGDMFTSSAETEAALDNIKELADEFTKYGIAVEQTIELAAKVAQMGNMGDALEQQVTQATRLAVLGGIEQQEALDTTISLTNAFGIAAEDLAGKIAFLNAAENQTILSIEDFNEAIPKAGSVVQQLGGDVEDLAFFLTAMREGGVNASQGANALKSSLGRLINPTAVARQELAGFGIDILGIVENNAGNLREMVLELGYELDRLDPLNRARAIEQLFGKFQFARMSTMFQNIVKDGSQARAVLDLTANSTEELAILAERELARVEDSVSFKFQKQIEKLQAALAPIGGEFLKAITPIVEGATKLLKWFNGLGDGAKQFAVLTIAAIGVIAPTFLMLFGLVANGFANFIKGIQKVGSFLGLLSGQSKLVGGSTNYMTQEQIEAQAISASLNQTHQNLFQTFTAEAGAVDALAAAYYRAATQMARLNPATIAGGSGAAAATSGGTGRYNPFMPPKKYNKGVVMVPGPKGKGDIIPAMLTPGEAVIPADQTRKYLPLIKGIVNDSLPGYQTSNIEELSPEQRVAAAASRAESFAQSAGAGSQQSTGILKRIQDEAAKRVRDLGEDLDVALNTLVDAVEGIGQSAVKKIADFDESEEWQSKKAERTDRPGQIQQAHMGPESTVVSAGRASQVTPGSNALASLSKLEEAQGTNYGVREYHSWTRGMEGPVNRRLGVPTSQISAAFASNPEGAVVGATAAEVANEFGGDDDNAIIASYGEALQATNADASDPEITGPLLEYDRRIKQLLLEKLEENADLMILDTNEQLAAIPAEQQGNYASLEAIEQQAAGEYLEGTKAENYRTAAMATPREHRFPGATTTQIAEDARAALEQEKITPEDYDYIQSGIVEKSGGKPQFQVPMGQRKEISKDVMSELPALEAEANDVGESVGEGVIQGAKDSLQIASPSKRMFDIGKNAGDSLVDGFESSEAGSSVPPPPPRPGELPLPGAPQAPAGPSSAGQSLWGRVKSGARNVAAKATDRLARTGPGQQVLQSLADAGGHNIVDSEGNIIVTPTEIPESAPPPVDPNKAARDEALIARNQDLLNRGLVTVDPQNNMIATDLGKAQGLPDVFSPLQEDLENLGNTARSTAADVQAHTDAVRENGDAASTSTAQSGLVPDPAGSGNMVTPAQAKKTEKEIRRTNRQQKRRDRSTKALVGLGAVTAGLGAATQLNIEIPGIGNIADLAQKFMPIAGALTAILPILLALPGPIALLVAIIGVGIFAWVKYNKMLDDARKRGYDFATALGTGEAAMQKFAEFAGTVSSQERLDRQLDQLGRPLQYQPGETPFGVSFAQSDVGAEFVNQLNQAISSMGLDAAIGMSYQQLALAVADQTLTLDQARSIAVALGDQIGSSRYSIEVNGKLIDLFGPGGEDLFDNPLELQVIFDEIVDDATVALSDSVLNGITQFTTDSQEVIDKYVEDTIQKRQAEGIGFFARGGIERDLARFLQSGVENREQESAIERLISAITAGAGEFAVSRMSEEERQMIERVTGFSPEEIFTALDDLESEVSFEIQKAALSFDIEEEGFDPRKQVGLRLAADELNAEQLGESMGTIASWFNVLQTQLSSALVVANENIDAAKATGDLQEIQDAYDERNELLLSIEEAHADNLRQLLGEARNVDIPKTTSSEQEGRGFYDEGLLAGYSQDQRKVSFQDQNARILEGIEDSYERSVTDLVLNGILGGYETDQEFSTNMLIRGMIEDGDIKAATIANLLDGITEPGKKQEVLDAVANLTLSVGEDYTAKVAELADNIEDPEVRAEFILQFDDEDIEPGDLATKIEAAAGFVRLRGAFPEMPDNYFTDPTKLEDYAENEQKVAGMQGDYSQENLEGAFGPELGKELYDLTYTETFKGLNDAAKQEYLAGMSVLITAKGEDWLIEAMRDEYGDGAIIGGSLPGMMGPGIVADPKVISEDYGQYLGQTQNDPGTGGSETDNNDNGGGSGEDQGSFLDEIVEKYRNFGDASQELTTGFEESLAAIMEFADGGTWGLNGLARQLRRLDVSETMIEKFLGMDPEEWEKIKPRLFEVDEKGDPTGLTEEGKAVQQAEAKATIAEEIDNVDAQTKQVEDQLTAYEKLVAQGASVELAYEMIQNEALATAIATAETTAEVRELIKAQEELKELEGELEEIDEEEKRKERIREAVKGMNEEFEDQVKALNKVRAATDKYTDAQIKAIFGNKDLRSLFLEPEIDKKALEKALDNAEKQAKLELDIKLLTFEGREEYLNEAFTKAKDKLSAEETRIELDFNAEIKGQEDIIDQAQNEISSLSYMIDDYQAQLDEIQYREDEINEKYDKRFEALDKIADINDRIAQQQQNQLDLAEALSSGDIAAAAQAAQKAREQESKDSADAQRTLLEQRKEAELESIRGLGGLTRKELEDQIDILERRIVGIEESRLEPAEEYIRLAEIRRKKEIENLEVLGRTSEEWDRIQNALDVARTRNYEFMNELRDQFAMYPEILQKYLEGEPLPAPPALPKPPPPKREVRYKWEGPAGGNWNWSERREASRRSQDRKARARGEPTRYGYAAGGYVSGGMFRRMSMGGVVPSYMAMGGKPLGSDLVPAMLTPGEFVIRRPAVNEYGIDRLERINRGTDSSGSVYNYNLAVNVRSDSNPEQIANTVMREIKRVDSQRMRNNRY